MKRIKLFEDFKLNNIEGDLITIEDIIECINKGGLLYAETINDYPDHNEEEGLKVLDIDNDGLITVEINSEKHEVDLDNVIKIDY